MIHQYALVLASYICGSIPFGLVVSKLLYKIDIRQHGSGNIGATNVSRTCGKLAGILVFLLDFYKAVAVLILAKQYFKTTIDLELMICFSAIVGHSYSIFLKFKGGKGVSSAFACILVMYPLLAASLAIFWVVLFALFRNVGLASVSAAILLSISAFQVLAYMHHIPTFTFLFLVSALVIYKHIQNINLIKSKLNSH